MFFSSISTLLHLFIVFASNFDRLNRISRKKKSFIHTHLNGFIPLNHVNIFLLPDSLQHVVQYWMFILELNVSVLPYGVSFIKTLRILLCNS